MKQKRFLLIALAVFTVTLAACAELGLPKLNSSLTMRELADKIEKEIDFGMMLSASTEEGKDYQLADSGLSTGILRDYEFRVNLLSGPFCLLLAEVSNPNDKQKVIDGFEALLSKHDEFFPDKGGSIADEGSYIMLVISPDNEKAVSIFKQAAAENH